MKKFPGIGTDVQKRIRGLLVSFHFAKPCETGEHQKFHFEFVFWDIPTGGRNQKIIGHLYVKPSLE